MSYTVGLQHAQPHDRPLPLGMSGFLSFARELGADCIELDGRWLTPLDDDELSRVRDVLRESAAAIVCSVWLRQQPGETLADAIRCTKSIDASLLRLHLTPVLEGARAAAGLRWTEMLAHARGTMKNEARRAADAGLALAIENHQDLTSEELLAIASDAGDNVGVVFDTGNAFAVGEDPVEFARRARDRIKHLHLKDYVAQFTPEGYRLLRCAIGAGCVPFHEIVDMLPTGLTASIEPGALEARHIRMFIRSWWDGYPLREGVELATALGRLQRRKLAEGDEWRTPWERGVRGQPLVDFETGQVRQSVRNLRSMGLLSSR